MIKDRDKKIIELVWKYFGIKLLKDKIEKL
jgi:hypothetical protein